jgi:tRNA(fMet)-specific endonuclease VapC
VGVILDTSVIVEAERRTIAFESLLASMPDEPVGLASITASELLHGCHRASDAGTRGRRFAFVEALLELIPVLDFGMAEARRHAELWAGLARKGTTVGAHDLMIGATALAHGYSLATLNVRDFRRIPGLRLVAVEPFIT